MKNKVQITWQWLAKYMTLGCICGLLLKTIGVTLCTSVICAVFIWNTVWVARQYTKRITTQEK